MRRALGALALAGVCASTPAHAENLLLALSSQQVTIASNYQGSDVTLFGAIRDDSRVLGRDGEYDVVVTTRGPAKAMTVRLKQQVAGFWINRESRTYRRAPSYLAALSSRPLESIADPAARSRERLGLLAATERPGAPDERTPRAANAESASETVAFAAALVRLQGEKKMWREDGAGVSFLDRRLFRATIMLPPDVPFGAFEVEAQLFSRGAPIARETITFRVVKAGFEARLAELADTSRLAYGVVAAMLALLFGWTASVIFRRD